MKEEKCNCDFCQKHARLKHAMESNHIILVKETLLYFADQWVCLSEDYNYEQCLIDGSYPNADEIIKKRRNPNTP